VMFVREARAAPVVRGLDILAGAVVQKIELLVLSAARAISYMLAYVRSENSRVCMCLAYEIVHVYAHYIHLVCDMAYTRRTRVVQCARMSIRGAHTTQTVIKCILNIHTYMDTWIHTLIHTHTCDLPCLEQNPVCPCRYARLGRGVVTVTRRVKLVLHGS
jgi:hypothetical protein